MDLIYWIKKISYYFFKNNRIEDLRLSLYKTFKIGLITGVKYESVWANCLNIIRATYAFNGKSDSVKNVDFIIMNNCVGSQQIAKLVVTITTIFVTFRLRFSFFGIIFVLARQSGLESSILACWSCLFKRFSSGTFNLFDLPFFFI